MTAFLNQHCDICDDILWSVHFLISSVSLITNLSLISTMISFPNQQHDLSLISTMRSFSNQGVTYFPNQYHYVPWPFFPGRLSRWRQSPWLGPQPTPHPHNAHFPASRPLKLGSPPPRRPDTSPPTLILRKDWSERGGRGYWGCLNEGSEGNVGGQSGEEEENILERKGLGSEREKVGGKSQSGTRIVTLKRNEILLRQTRSHENTHTHNPHTHTNIHT